MRNQAQLLKPVLCVSKLCVADLCAGKLCVSKKEAGGAADADWRGHRQEGTLTVVYQKQEPHKKMW